MLKQKLGGRRWWMFARPTSRASIQSFLVSQIGMETRKRTYELNMVIQNSYTDGGNGNYT